MWESNTLWKHEQMRDVAFAVLERFYIEEKKLWKLTVTWFNIGKCHEPWMMDLTQKITIPADKCSEWKRFGFKDRRQEHALDTQTNWGPTSV